MVRLANSLVVAALAWLAFPVSAEEAAKPEPVLRKIELTYASASDLARQFTTAASDNASAADRLREERRDFLRRAITDATRGIRPVPQVMTDPGLYPFSERPYAEVRLAQAPGAGGGLAAFMPDGITEPPTAALDQNALLVRGTPKAVDEFAELVRMLDVPPKQVNIEVKLLNIVSKADEGWGADLMGRNRNAEFFLQGPAPLGPTIRIAGDNVNALLAANRSTTRSNNTAAAHVTTSNNTPAVVRAATVIPVVLASVTFDQFGNRQVDYTIDAVATGIELFVLPRISADDSVTMRLQPSFIDATGQVVGPDGSTAPILQEAGVDTVVRVKDGETLLLGGFPRSNQALQATGLPVNFRKSSSIEDIDSLLFVTPRIVRFLEP